MKKHFDECFSDERRVVMCEDCVYSRQLTEPEKNVFVETVVMCTNPDMHDYAYAWPMYKTDYCSYGKAKEVPNGGSAD